jgi:hypothetical protein
MDFLTFTERGGKEIGGGTIEFLLKPKPISGSHPLTLP